MNSMYNGGDGSKTATPQGIPAPRHDVALGRAKEHGAAVQLCEMLGGAACTAAPARGHARPRAWRDLGEQIGSTVCIPLRRRLSSASYVDCWRTVATFSGASDPVERDRHPQMPQLPARKRKSPRCMGFIARFLGHLPPPSQRGLVRKPENLWIGPAPAMAQGIAARSMNSICRSKMSG